MKNKKALITIVTLIVLLVVFMVGAKVYQSGQKKKLSFLGQANASLFVPEHAYRMGAEDPQVYLVEFFDPECESCRQFYPLVKSILNEFEGKVQLVLRYAAYHQNSVFAIKVLEAARKQDKYKEVLELLYEYQPIWGSHHDPRPDLVWTYLPKIQGLDVGQLKKDMEDPKIMELIEQDKKDGETLMVQGTPTFFVNGKPQEDFGYESLRGLVGSEIKD